MRVALTKSLKARLAAGLLCLMVVSPAVAAPGPALENALKLQAAELSRVQAFVLACEVPAPPDVAAAWGRTKSMVVATLSVNRVTPDTVAKVKASLDGSPSETDCTDDRLRAAAEHMASDWVGRMTYQLEQLGFTIKSDLPDPAIWEAAKPVIVEQTQRQARLLACLAVRQPLFLPGEVDRWDKEVVATVERLVGYGFSHESILTLLRGTAMHIWRPVDGEEAEALMVDCDADAQWYEDWSLFNVPRILQPVEALLR